MSNPTVAELTTNIARIEDLIVDGIVNPEPLENARLILQLGLRSQEVACEECDDEGTVLIDMSAVLGMMSGYMEVCCEHCAKGQLLQAQSEDEGFAAQERSRGW